MGETLAPLQRKLAGQAVISTGRQINASLFEALAVERVAMFVVLSIIVLVAVFNILSSLIMLVRAKTRDIAILRTMGATRGSLLQDIRDRRASRSARSGRARALILGFMFLFFRRADRARDRASSPGRMCGIRRSASSPNCRAGPDPGEIVGDLPDGAGVQLSSPRSTRRCRAANTDPVQVLRYE